MVAVSEMRYIAKYLRISEDDDDMGEWKRESNSISNQRKMLDSYIAAHEELSGYPVKEFVDDGVSGVSFRRPGVQSLLAEVRGNKIYCIVVKDLSRFGRNYIEVGDYIEQIFPFVGVRFISVADSFDSFRDTAGIDIGFKNLIHDLYSRDLSAKVKASIKIRQKKGAYNGGGIPFGYKLGGGKDEPFVPDPEAAGIVKKIFILAADGNTTLMIADRLNREAVPTPGAYKKSHGGISYCLKNEKLNLWRTAQVNLILRNEVYRGTYIAHKLSTVRPGVVQKNEMPEYVILENHHERLVEEALFQKAQNVLRLRGKTGKKTEYESALKGKVKCGCCGYSMSIRHDAKIPYYRCWNGKGCGSYQKINVELLESMLWNVIQKLAEAYRKQDAVRQGKLLQMRSAHNEAKEKKQMLETKIEHCRLCRLELYDQWKEGMISKEEYIRKKEEVNGKETGYRNESEQLEQYLKNLASGQETLEQTDSLAVLSGAECLTKELVDGLIERVEVYAEDRVEIRWKIRDFVEE
ncbi:MAG: recombinase family protein [Lachnospiraceae bacterium]|nr:recombinase family protein [uncultured Acetatifactor sp.]MCI8286476.1 recombinase family protein [Lachnospiraceae bacterium]